MQRRRDDSIKGRIARARARLSGKAPVAPVGPPPRKRRVPRREIEARRQRLLRLGLAIAGVALVVLLVGGALYENVLKPNQTLANVGATSISRQDYWKVRAHDLYEQALQYQDFAQFVGPDQQNQYLSMAQQSLGQLPGVWGSTDVDRSSLEKMIDDQVYLQGMDELGLAPSPEEVRTFALNRFAPPGAPLIPARPSPTLTAARAAMATGTAAAFLATPMASPIAATPLPATPVAATPVAANEMASPIATPLPIASPVPPSGTPGPADARATAEAGFTRFEETLFAVAHLTPDDYDELVVTPALARQKVGDALAADIGQSAPQVQAAHMLLATREEAEAARSRIVDGGEDFATVARELSTDRGTAENGGELGWFVREEMVTPFADAAFALQPGAISEPVASEFGWHVIQVEDTDSDRPLTDSQISRIEEAVTDRWLEEQKTTLSIRSSLPPAPTPFAPGFQPPVGAPPLPAPPTSAIGTPSG